MKYIFYYHLSTLFEEYFKRESSFNLKGKTEGQTLSVFGEGGRWTANILFKNGKLPNGEVFSSGEVFQTIGENCPLFLGDKVRVKVEDGDFIVRLKIEELEPEVLVRRYMRPGELSEAERIFRQKELFCNMIPVVGVITLLPTALLFGFERNQHGMVSGFVFLLSILTLVILAKIKNQQLKGVID